MAEYLINKTLKELSAIFGGRYKIELGDSDKLKAYRQQLLRGFIENNINSETMIQAGFRKARDYAQDPKAFFPGPHVIVGWCRTEHKFPDVLVAYNIAGTQVGKHPKHREWQHGAIEWTAKEIGSFDLKTKTQSEVLPRFKSVYKTICERWARGERPTISEDRRIEKTEAPPASKEFNINAMANLRANLGI